MSLGVSQEGKGLSVRPDGVRQRTGLPGYQRAAGRPTRALVLASEARELAERRGLEAGRRFALSELANVHGIMGDLERCRAVAGTLLHAEPAGRGVHRTSTLSGLATAELWVGDPSTGPRLRLRDRSRPVVTRGTPSRRRVAGQQAGASRWHS